MGWAGSTLEARWVLRTTRASMAIMSASPTRRPQSSSRTEDRPTLVSTHVQVESEPPPTSICPLEQVRSRPTKFGLTSRPLQLTPQAPRSHPSRPLCPYRVTVLDRGSRSEPAMGLWLLTCLGAAEENTSGKQGSVLRPLHPASPPIRP
jgi:hypothetical protein